MVNYIAVFALAVALAMDALAVAVATGLRMRCSLGQTVRMAAAFGFFQFLMPVAGWALGLTVRRYIEAYDHWVAFILLAFVGGRMIYEGLKKAEPENCADPTRGFTLMVLSIATSIDALAVGISMAVLNVEIWQPAAVIGIVCFAMTALGMHLGRIVVRENSSLGHKANIVGGVILFCIGMKILYEHHAFDWL